MKKFLRIAVLLSLIAVLAFFEVRWIAQVDYENQRARTEDLMAEVAGEMNIIKAGLMDGGEVGEARGRFEGAFAELEAIDYARHERGEVLGELAEYAENLPAQVELARELKVLKNMCDGFVKKIEAEMKNQKVEAELFRKINTEFVEFGENLPTAKYVSTQGLVANLEGLIKQVGVSAAATVNCVGVCSEATIGAQATALAGKIDEVGVGVDEINRAILEEFDSSVERVN